MLRPCLFLIKVKKIMGKQLDSKPVFNDNVKIKMNLTMAKP